MMHAMAWFQVHVVPNEICVKWERYLLTYRVFMNIHAAFNTFISVMWAELLNEPAQLTKQQQQQRK